jgi:hypothetical protein
MNGIVTFDGTFGEQSIILEMMLDINAEDVP